MHLGVYLGHSTALHLVSRLRLSLSSPPPPSHLYEEPGCDEGKATVLPVEAVVVRVKAVVVQEEESVGGKGSYKLRTSAGSMLAGVLMLRSSRYLAYIASTVNWRSIRGLQKITRRSVTVRRVSEGRKERSKNSDKAVYWRYETQMHYS